MTSDLSAPPVLSTPAEYILEDATDTAAPAEQRPQRTDDELYQVYEVAKTVAEIRDRAWRRVALQFPDAMLADAPWVVEALEKELAKLGPLPRKDNVPSQVSEENKGKAAAAEDELEVDYTQPAKVAKEDDGATRFYILGDTSYGSCCVDEIAAEHADAEAVVHYGRACLSPTARLPVLHIFTRQQLDYDDVLQRFATEFPEASDRIIVMADVMFQEHVAPICELLLKRGYDVMATEIVRDPMGAIPNRKLVLPAAQDVQQAGHADLKDHRLFHISTPPKSLLLTLSSRLASLHIYPTPASPYSTTSDVPDPSATPGLLRRRYALVIRLATASIIGILVNTLSVKNYLSTIAQLREQIAAAGKKSYTIVVGKLNAAKLANFAEVDGWVVVGCWESGLVEQDGLWKPVITPFELGLALAGDDERIWDGSWWGGIEGVAGQVEKQAENSNQQNSAENGTEEPHVDAGDEVDDDESEPPEFDLRTGKLVSNSRPMRVAIRAAASNAATTQNGNPAAADKGSALVARAKAGELAMVNGVASPGAEYLRSQRTWLGLGSDFNNTEDGEDGEDEASTVVEEGRSGVARGYTVGADASKA